MMSIILKKILKPKITKALNHSYIVTSIVTCVKGNPMGMGSNGLLGLGRWRGFGCWLQKRSELATKWPQKGAKGKKIKKNNLAQSR
jgi:hypothetical protein